MHVRVPVVVTDVLCNRALVIKEHSTGGSLPRRERPLLAGKTGGYYEQRSAHGTRQHKYEQRDFTYH